MRAPRGKIKQAGRKDPTRSGSRLVTGQTENAAAVRGMRGQGHWHSCRPPPLAAALKNAINPLADDSGSTQDLLEPTSPVRAAATHKIPSLGALWRVGLRWELWNSAREGLGYGLSLRRPCAGSQREGERSRTARVEGIGDGVPSRVGGCLTLDRFTGS